jgi:hypothetical protein
VRVRVPTGSTRKARLASQLAPLVDQVDERDVYCTAFELTPLNAQS